MMNQLDQPLRTSVLLRYHALPSLTDREEERICNQDLSTVLNQDRPESLNSKKNSSIYKMPDLKLSRILQKLLKTYQSIGLQGEPKPRNVQDSTKVAEDLSEYRSSR
ncbi:hypothetical protein QE152_g878 [Popillia japonica]|uniref:Uncharacterized protein n=1 Tax=Popillia japonica TaxID=7064 RepID=A0AAW1NAR3_POPJA